MSDELNEAISHEQHLKALARKAQVEAQDDRDRYKALCDKLAEAMEEIKSMPDDCGGGCGNYCCGCIKSAIYTAEQALSAYQKARKE